MDELKKLRTLLLHWKEHNEEHAKTYRDWAEKVSLLDNPELIEVLRRLSNETEKLSRFFEEAIRRI